MSLRVTLSTAGRVLLQIRHDPRTIALMLVVPAVLLLLFYWVFEGQPGTFQQIGAPLCGLFPFIIMFLITSISMLRERTSGTLERLMTLPLGKADILAGYGLAFGALAALQAIIICVIGFPILGLVAAHGTWVVILLAIGNAILGMALGLFVSAFSQTEFQAVQFMPAIVFPQLILCGLFVPRNQMADVLYAISWALPFTYAYEALSKATSYKPLDAAFAADVLVVVGSTIIALGLGAVTLRRRTG